RERVTRLGDARFWNAMHWEVLARQSAGADEREMAEALFVTPSTIHDILTAARPHLDAPA
ncbi:hypothetical protein, partial [Frankia canadensis]